MKTTYTFPGFVDVHVHFRDPGLPAAETTASGLAAAVRGGMRTVVTMPNTVPACDSPDLMRYQRAAAAASGVTGCTLLTSACITKGRLGKEVADLEALAEAGAAFFTDDGSYVADDKVMEEAMRRAYDLNIVVCQHAMDPQELKGGVIRDCDLARKLNLPIISVETETKAIRRDLSLCRETGCRLHIQHISTAAGVELVRAAQREGLPVTAEAMPHHLLLTCDDLVADDANFKMAPPLGNREDRAELRRAGRPYVRDGPRAASGGDEGQGLRDERERHHRPRGRGSNHLPGDGRGRGNVCRGLGEGLVREAVGHHCQGESEPEE